MCPSCKGSDNGSGEFGAGRMAAICDRGGECRRMERKKNNGGGVTADNK